MVTEGIETHEGILGHAEQAEHLHRRGHDGDGHAKRVHVDVYDGPLVGNRRCPPAGHYL